MRKYFHPIITVGALLLLCSESSVATAKTVTACTTPSKIVVIQESLNSATTSTTFSTVPSASINLNTAIKGCIIVSFSAQAYAPDNDPTGNYMDVQAVLDGAASADGQVQLQSDSGQWSNVHTFVFTFPGVATGLHSVKIQYKSAHAGQSVAINNFDMLVYHN